MRNVVPELARKMRPTVGPSAQRRGPAFAALYCRPTWSLHPSIQTPMHLTHLVLSSLCRPPCYYYSFLPIPVSSLSHHHHHHHRPHHHITTPPTVTIFGLLDAPNHALLPPRPLLPLAAPSPFFRPVLPSPVASAHSISFVTRLNLRGRLPTFSAHVCSSHSPLCCPLLHL